MSDLRAKVEALGPVHIEQMYRATDHGGFENHPLDCVYRDEVLALIPEGAVLVMEESLAAALTATIANFWQPDGWDAEELASDVRAYSLPYLLAKLREGE